ncbi:hypothetical protein D3C72_2023690 [compost metagenome]
MNNVCVGDLIQALFLIMQTQDRSSSRFEISTNAGEIDDFFNATFFNSFGDDFTEFILIVANLLGR